MHSLNLICRGNEVIRKICNTCFLEAAIQWFRFGFSVIPVIPNRKQSAVKWDAWLDNLSEKSIENHWTTHPEHEIGCIVGDQYLVLDTDTPEATTAVEEIEKSFGIKSNLIVDTTKGVHKYYGLRQGAKGKNDSHSSVEYPDRIDIKTGRGLVILPPSTGKTINIIEAQSANELVKVSQEFVNAVFRHNGRPAPDICTQILPHAAYEEGKHPKSDQLHSLINQLDPDRSYEDWVHVGMIIHNETDGSDEGLVMFDDWSKRGGKYKGTEEIETKWHSFKNYTGKPLGMGTLIHMVNQRGHDHIDILSVSEPGFQKLPAYKANPLDQYNLTGKIDELKRDASEQIPILGNIALSGQSTVIYAAPNTGKTLLVIRLLTEAIEQGRIDPRDLYYFNMDDNYSGLLEKLELAKKYGFQMIAEGHQNFSSKNLLDTLESLTANNMAKGTIIVLDTLKKVADLMDKRNSSDFGNTIRGFVSKGGTCISLAHTNKHLGEDGKPIYAGTTDITEDSDCAIIMYETVHDEDKKIKVVKFENLKARGHVAKMAEYQYSIQEDISYKELFDSVHPMDETEFESIHTQNQIQEDDWCIDIVHACIQDDINTKMEMVEALAYCSKISNQSAKKVIDKYTGSDPEKHLWNYEVQEHGRHVYTLLEECY